MEMEELRMHKVQRILQDENIATSVACVLLEKYLHREVTIYEYMSLKNDILLEVENPWRRPDKALMASYRAKTDASNFIGVMQVADMNTRERVLQCVDEVYEKRISRGDEEMDRLFGIVYSEHIGPEEYLNATIGELSKEVIFRVKQIKLFQE